MLKWILLLGAIYAAPVCGAAPLVEIDGLHLNIPEAEFLKIRPGTVGGKDWYLYEPVPATAVAFGFPVRGYMRGFESGQGCAAAVGFSKTSTADTEKLQQAIENTLSDNLMAKSSVLEQGGAHFEYWEGATTYASVSRFDKGRGHYAISLQIVLKSCPDSVITFQARAPQTPP